MTVADVGTGSCSSYELWRVPLVAVTATHLPQVVIAILGGLATVVVLGFYARSLRGAHIERKRLRDDLEPVFIGGARFRATGGNVSGARWNLTSPFAQLEMHQNRVVLSLREQGRIFARNFDPPVPTVTTLSFEEIDCFDTFANGGIRFRTKDADDDRDGLVFWATRRDRAAILGWLTEAGVRRGSIVDRRSRGVGIPPLRREIVLTLPLVGVAIIGGIVVGWYVAALALIPAAFWLFVVATDHRRR